MLDALLKLLNGEVPKEVVWTADITYWLEGRRVAGDAEKSWNTDRGFLELHRKLGLLPYYHYVDTEACVPAYHGGVESRLEVSEGKRITRLHTPIGELREEYTLLPGSCCYAPTKHFVESREDLDILLYALERRRLVPANLDKYQQRVALLREYDGLPLVDLTPSPLANFCNKMAGVANMVYLIMDYEDKVRTALHLMAEQEGPMLDAVCETAPALVHFTDNLSSENFTGFYDEYLLPDHKRRLAKLQGAGVKCVVHLDGTVRGLLPKLVKAGFDAVEALTPKPVGDVTVDEMVQLAGNDKVILWGGVPGAMFAPPFTWKQMERHVQHVLDCWGGRPFILGTADQVPPDGDITFCRKIADMLPK